MEQWQVRALPSSFCAAPYLSETSKLTVLSSLLLQPVAVVLKTPTPLPPLSASSSLSDKPPSHHRPSLSITLLISPPLLPPSSPLAPDRPSFVDDGEQELNFEFGIWEGEVEGDLIDLGTP